MTSSSLLATTLPEWALSSASSCGPNVEYSPDYMALQAALLPQDEVQYGDFIDMPEGPNWSDIGRDCLQLLQQTKDINLLIIWLRSQTRLAGAQGLAQGLGVLSHLLTTYPDTIHPQPVIEGEYDLHMRANALSQLNDPEGLLSDIRHVSLSHHTARPLSLHDIERAYLIPQREDAIPLESVQQQIAVLHTQQDKDLQAILNASAYLKTIVQWIQQYLPDMTVKLDQIESLFHQLETVIHRALPVKTQTNTPVKEDIVTMQTPITNKATFVNSAPLASRQQATQSLQHIRKWFEDNEPSSPVSVLLWQAEKMIGRRFYEVAQSIPLDVLERWEKDIQRDA